MRRPTIRSRWIFMLTGCGLLVPMPGDAQENGVLVPGQRLRATRTGEAERPLTGILVERTPSGLVLDVEGGGLTTVSHESLARLEMFSGRQRHGGKGALIGGLVGAGAFTGLALAVERCDTHCIPFMGYVFYFGGSVGVGALLGYLVGDRIQTDRWEDISTAAQVGAQVAVSMGPDRSVEVGLSLPFR